MKKINCLSHILQKTLRVKKSLPNGEMYITRAPNTNYWRGYIVHRVGMYTTVRSSRKHKSGSYMANIELIINQYTRTQYTYDAYNLQRNLW